MKTIGIIGAGISGLTTAKTLQEHGFRVKVWEKNSEVGGVWASSRRYPGICSQNGKDSYAFTDYPMPKHYPEWPEGEQIQAYLESYAKHFFIFPHISFNTTVTKATQDKETKNWTIHTQQVSQEETKITTVDYLIIANGIHHEPNIPNYEGVNAFKRTNKKLYHSSQFNDLVQTQGKKVIIVGFGKSACDIAEQVATTASETRLVFRRAIWKIPRKFFGFLNYKYLLVNRLGESLFPYPDQYKVEKFLHRRGRFLLNGIWKSLSFLINRQFQLEKYKLLPTDPITEVGSSRLSLITQNFGDKVKRGAIKLHKAGIKKFTENGVLLNTGQFFEADMVICATGWKQNIPFLSTDITAKIRDEQGNFQLYRHILPLKISNLAFNGYNSSLCCAFTAEMAAHWIAQHIKGKLKLPDLATLQQNLATYQAWLLAKNKQYASPNAVSLVPFTFHYTDGLMDDMGLPRNGNGNWFTAWLLPFQPKRYKGLTEKLGGNRHET